MYRLGGFRYLVRVGKVRLPRNKRDDIALPVGALDDGVIKLQFREPEGPPDAEARACTAMLAWNPSGADVDQPNVKSKTSAPGSRNSISMRRLEIGPACLTS